MTTHDETERKRNARNCKPRLRTGRRKSGSLKTGKRCCGKSYPKRNAGTRSHRLIVRGAVFESIVPEAKTMTDEEAAAFLRLALTSEEARGLSEKTHQGREKRIIPLAQRAHLSHPYGCVRSAEGLSAQRESRLLPSLTDIGGFAATRGCTPCAAYAAIPAHPQKQYTRRWRLYHFCGFYYPIRE